MLNDAAEFRSSVARAPSRDPARLEVRAVYARSDSTHRTRAA